MKTKQIPLTADQLRELLNYDQETGLFTRKVKTYGRYGGQIGAVAGGDSGRGYIKISLMSRLYYAHRLAWLYMTGQWPTEQIDHRDGNRANNAFSNLRETTNAINGQNKRRAQSNNKTGHEYLGVSSARSNFVARIKAGDTHHYLGCFKTAAEARAAYITAKRRLHAGCTI